MFKPVVGYEEMYEVSSDGRVRSIRRGIEMKPYIARNRNKGYFRVSLCVNWITKKFMVHRMVAEAFIPNPENLPFVNHKDRNTFNNDVTNLEWCTAQENAEHALSVEYKFKDPEGQEVVIFNLTKFCRDNNLTQANMWKVVVGERTNHKGWTNGVA